MSGGIISPVFVGRDQELAALDAAMAVASGGDPVFALIGGEAGIGKTRLAEEFATRAATAGFAVLTGNCVELGAEGLPLAPVISALRALSRMLPPAELADLVGPAAGGLSRLLPELAPPGGPAAVTAGADSAVSLPELVAGLLGRLCSLRPVLLVIEDLHWADQSTLELIAYLVRTLREVPLLAVVTYRSDELRRRHPLRALLTGWERVRSTRRIELGSLDRDEVADQLTGIFGASPEPDLADLIFDRSGGKAYLVEELASVASDPGRPGSDAGLPPSLRDVLLHRADSLSPAAQHLLRAASAGGRRVAEGLLAAVAGTAEAELYPALREAVDGHVLVVDAAGTGYEFRHALTRDALYEDMLPNPAAHLRSLGALGGGGRLIQRIPLSAAWRETRVEVEAPGAFDGDGEPGLLGVKAVLWRGRDDVLPAAEARDGGLRMPATAVPLADLALARGDAGARRLSWASPPDEPPFYRWQARLTYAPQETVDSPAEIWTEPQVSTSADLDLFPPVLAPLRRVQLRLGAGHDAALVAVEAEVTAHAPDGALLARRRLIVTPAQPTQAWAVRRSHGEPTVVEAALTHRYAGGRPVSLRPQVLTNPDLVANTPFATTVELTPLPQPYVGATTKRPLPRHCCCP